MNIINKKFEISKDLKQNSLLGHLTDAIVPKLMDEGLAPLRFAITDSKSEKYICEVGVTDSLVGVGFFNHIFHFRKREFENTEKFNIAMIVPTGIGCDIGGHAGDATPAARLLASVCDTLITHPNVVNASDINEMTDNTLYVEGSVLTKVLMGKAGLQKVRSNRILALVERNEFSEYAVNSINAARATLGINCDIKLFIPSLLKMSAHYSESTSAVGKIQNLNYFLSMVMRQEYPTGGIGDYNALAITSRIDVPHGTSRDYFNSRQGMIITPWGGVESMLTHAISQATLMPSAHAPMLESEEVRLEDYGVVDARMAAEVVSQSFLHCVLKGLHKSPQIVTDFQYFLARGIISVEDISCLVIPDGCLGLPTLAAAAQGIPIIAVTENKNIMKNDLSSLPFRKGKLFYASTYAEAAGLATALKNGITPASTSRPLASIHGSDFQNIPDKG